MNIVNNSPIAATSYFMMDKEGAEVVLLIVKGTWRIAGCGELTLADEQEPIRSEPLYRAVSYTHLRAHTRLLSISYAVFCLKKKTINSKY